MEKTIIEHAPDVSIEMERLANGNIKWKIKAYGPCAIRAFDSVVKADHMMQGTFGDKQE